MHPPRSPAPAVITAIGVVVLILGVWPNWWFKGKPTIGDSYSDSFSDDDFGDRMKVEFEFGLREISTCMGGGCPSTDYDSLVAQLGVLDEYDEDNLRGSRGDGGRGQLKRFVWAGRVTFWCGMIAALGLLLSTVLWMTRQRLPFSLPAVGGALAGVTAIAGTIAFVTEPIVPGLGSVMKFDLQMGLGYPMCLLGSIACAVGAFQLHKEERGFATFGATPAYGQQPYYGGQPYPGPGPYVGGPAPYAPPQMGGPVMQVSPACPRCSAPAIFVTEYQRYFCSSCRAYL